LLEYTEYTEYTLYRYTVREDGTDTTWLCRNVTEKKKQKQKQRE